MFKQWIVSIMLGLLAAAGMAAEYYVSPGGNDANDGTSWAKAKKTIQAGVNAAQDGDTVRVAGGTYVLSSPIGITKSVRVCSSDGVAATVVDGGYPATTNACFKLANAAAVVDGFSIINAYDRSGCEENGEGYGGVYLNQGVLQNCWIAGNVPNGVAIANGVVQNCLVVSNETGIEMNGGTVQFCRVTGSGQEGIIIYEAGTVLHCTIVSNTASGVYNENGIVRNCTISYNSCGSSPGGIWNRGLVENCLISGNFGGGGAYNRYGGILRNCVISGNQTRFCGGGVYNELGTVQNCTIVGNAAADTGGGVYNYWVSGYVYSGAVENCIVYFNSAPMNANCRAFPNTVNQFICADPAPDGAGNFAANPLFVDAGTGVGTNYVAGDLRLQAGSPCINTGTNRDWMTNAIDMAGNPRIIDGRVDLGAYEYNGGNPPPAPEIEVTVNDQSGNVTVAAGAPVSVKVALTPLIYLGVEADWWVVAATPMGYYYLNSSGQWLAAAGIADITPAYQGALLALPPTEVLNYTGLPGGAYTFYFGVGLRNGLLDPAGLWYAAVNLTVQ